MKIKKKLKLVSKKKYDKFIKRLPQFEDSEFFKSCYTKTDDKYEINTTLNKADIKRLKKTYKIIKKNKGIFSIGKIIFVLILLSGLTLFTIFVKDQLIKKLIIDSMENVFEAQVDINSLSSSFLKGEITVIGLEVTDKDTPMKNLFEINKAKLDISIEELTKGNVHIPIIECSGLSFNTDRTTSGAFKINTTSVNSNSEGTTSVEKSTDKKSLVDFSNIQDFDYEAILDNEKSNLTTTKKIEELQDLFEDKKVSWENRIEDSKKEISSIQKDITKVGDIKSVSNPIEIKDYITNITTLTKKLESVKSDALTIKGEYEKDLNIIKSSPNEIKDSILLDKEFLLSRIGLDGNTSPTGVISNFLSEYGDDKINKIYSIVLKSYNLWKKIDDKNKADNIKISRRHGTIFNFSRTVSPRFLIEKIVLSIGEDSKFSGQIENITSNNTLINKATTFNIVIPNFDVYGALDNRKDQNIITLEIKTDIPIKIPGLVSSFDIEEIGGNLESILNMDFKNIKNSNAAIAGVIKDLSISTTGNNPIIKAVLEQQKVMDLNGTFSIKDGKVDNINVSTNLDEILLDVTKDIAIQWVADQKVKAAEQVDLYFKDAVSDLGLNEYLDFVPSELDSIDSLVDKSVETLDKYKEEANDRLIALENIAKEKLEELKNAIPVIEEIEEIIPEVKELEKVIPKVDDIKKSFPKLKF